MHIFKLQKLGYNINVKLLNEIILLSELFNAMYGRTCMLTYVYDTQLGQGRKIYRAVVCNNQREKEGRKEGKFAFQDRIWI